MKLRNITSVFVMAALAGVCYAEPLIYMTGGGGGSVKPAATNAVLEAAYAYTDAATNAVVEAFIGSDPNLWANNSRIIVDGTNYAAGNSTPITLTEDTVSFEVTDAGDYTMFAEAIVPYEDEIYVAVSEVTANQKWDILFTTSTFGTAVDFDLVITLTPKATIASRDSKVLVYKLRRTF